MLEALVAVIAEHGPLVLLIDDLQWADGRTLAALGYLRRRAADLPLALVTTAPAIETLPGRPLGSLTPDTVVRLDPLSRPTWPRSGYPICTRRPAAARASSPRRSRTITRPGARGRSPRR